MDDNEARKTQPTEDPSFSGLVHRQPHFQQSFGGFETELSGTMSWAAPAFIQTEGMKSSLHLEPNSAASFSLNSAIRVDLHTSDTIVLEVYEDVETPTLCRRTSSTNLD